MLHFRTLSRRYKILIKLNMKLINSKLLNLQMQMKVLMLHLLLSFMKDMC